MRKSLAPSSLLFLIVACSSSALLDIPPVQKPPANWSQSSTLKFPNSNCPKMAGEYSETPVIYQSAGKVMTSSEDVRRSYYSYFPFHLADRKVLSDDEINLDSDLFLIRQTDADNFYISFKTHGAGTVEYHFRATEEDFACKNGYIEFPIVISDGMLEGMSANFQIRNVMFRDNTGALIIQKTIGPYRGNPSTASNRFKHEFIRYQLYERFPKLE